MTIPLSAAMAVDDDKPPEDCFLPNNGWLQSSEDTLSIHCIISSGSEYRKHYIVYMYSCILYTEYAIQYTEYRIHYTQLQDTVSDNLFNPGI